MVYLVSWQLVDHMRFREWITGFGPTYILITVERTLNMNKNVYFLFQYPNVRVKKKIKTKNCILTSC